MSNVQAKFVTLLTKTMLAWVLGLIALVVVSGTQAAGPTSLIKPEADKARLIEHYGRLPLSFEPNQGQTDSQVKFLSRGPGYGLFLTPTEAVLALHTPSKETKGSPSPLAGEGRGEGESAQKPQQATILRMQLLGANPKPQMAGMEELPGKVNYFRGNDPKQWRTNIPAYAKVRYEKIYPGIDLIYYGNQQQLEYDFVVAPGTDPETIKLSFAGADKLNVDAQGNLVLHTSGSEVRLRKPFVYQEINGKRREIEGHYILHPAKGKGNVQVGFHVAAYDKSKPLVIDPVLVYSTYLGGSDSEALCGAIVGIAVDSQGNAYVAGSTASLDFPTTAGAFDTTHNPFGDAGYTDAFVAKLDSTGSSLIYATYLGGSIQASTCGTDIAVDNQGSAYIAGITGFGVFNIDFPTTPGAFDTEYGPNSRIEVDDGFVTKLDKTGSTLLYSTYLGGSWYDYPLSIAVDNDGDAYITGWTGSGDFPITPGAFDTSIGGLAESFVVKLNATGTALVYSTYLGGMNTDLGNDIAVDDAGNAYVAGRTDSPNFPTTPGAFDTSFNQVHGGFVTKLNATGSALVYSTFLGGSSGNNELLGIAIDDQANAYMTGTTSQADFPTTPGAFDTSFNGGGNDVTVTKLDASGAALLYSTYLGGGNDDQARGIAVDRQNNAYITGYTISDDFPTASSLQEHHAGGGDAFITKLNAGGDTLIYSTYLGGGVGQVSSAFDSGSSIAVDSTGSIYVTGVTDSQNFPTTPGALMTSTGGNIDAFVVKISNGSDSDGDGLSDDYETANGLDPNDPSDAGLDPDGDGLTNLQEFQAGTDPQNHDTDSDGIPDGFEVANGLDPTNSLDAAQDADSDGLSNLREFQQGTNPQAVDSDGDGVPDGNETAQGATLGLPSTANPSGISAEPVNTATGNYLFQQTDLKFPGRGLPFAFTRTYNSADSYSGPLGQGWSHAYNAFLTEYPDGSVVIKHGDGREEFYDPVAAGGYQSRFPGVFNILTKNADGTFTLTAKDQVQHRFGVEGELSRINDRNGNALSFAYDAGGNLTTITDTVGRTITLSYDAGNRIIQVTDPIGRTITYGYDANGDPVRATDPQDGV